MGTTAGKTVKFANVSRQENVSFLLKCKAVKLNLNSISRRLKVLELVEGSL